MDYLILGVLVGSAIFAAVYVKVKLLKSRYVEGVSMSDGNKLVIKYIRTYDNKKLNPREKDEQMTKIINEMRLHSENVNMFAKNLPVELPCNVSSISSRCKG